MLTVQLWQLQSVAACRMASFPHTPWCAGCKWQRCQAEVLKGAGLGHLPAGKGCQQETHSGAGFRVPRHEVLVVAHVRSSPRARRPLTGEGCSPILILVVGT